jgi:hypothetical protein
MRTSYDLLEASATCFPVVHIVLSVRVPLFPNFDVLNRSRPINMEIRPFDPAEITFPSFSAHSRSPNDVRRSSLLVKVEAMISPSLHSGWFFQMLVFCSIVIRSFTCCILVSSYLLRQFSLSVPSAA